MIRLTNVNKTGFTIDYQNNLGYNIKVPLKIGREDVIELSKLLNDLVNSENIYRINEMKYDSYLYICITNRMNGNIEAFKYTIESNLETKELLSKIILQKFNNAQLIPRETNESDWTIRICDANYIIDIQIPYEKYINSSYVFTKIDRIVNEKNIYEIIKNYISFMEKLYTDYSVFLFVRISNKTKRRMVLELNMHKINEDLIQALVDKYHIRNGIDKKESDTVILVFKPGFFVIKEYRHMYRNMMVDKIDCDKMSNDQIYNIIDSIIEDPSKIKREYRERYKQITDQYSRKPKTKIEVPKKVIVEDNSPQYTEMIDSLENKITESKEKRQEINDTINQINKQNKQEEEQEELTDYICKLIKQEAVNQKIRGKTRCLNQ